MCPDPPQGARNPAQPVRYVECTKEGSVGSLHIRRLLGGARRKSSERESCYVVIPSTECVAVTYVAERVNP